MKKFHRGFFGNWNSFFFVSSVAVVEAICSSIFPLSLKNLEISGLPKMTQTMKLYNFRMNHCFDFKDGR